MSSRDQILASVKRNQPPTCILPESPNFKQEPVVLAEKFKGVLESIGGKVHRVNGLEPAIATLQQQFGKDGRMLTVLEPFRAIAAFYDHKGDPHLLENVEVAIIKAHFAVAENGAVWVSDDLLPNRVLPFICQHLVAVIDVKQVVPTMHDAYNRIGASEYGFGTFIAGPSKTADIEQSLVLGAHGPKTMTVFLLDLMIPEAGGMAGF